MNELADPAASELTAAADSRGIARPSVGLLVANVIGNAGFFVSALVLARLLGPSGRGVMAFFVVSALVGSSLVSLGLTDATSVAAARYPARRATVLGNAVFLSSVLGLLGAGLVGVLALFRNKLPAGIDGPVLGLLAAAILTTTVSVVASGFLRGCGRFASYARISAVAPWLYALVLIALWIGPGLDVRRAEVAWLVYAVCGGFATLVAALRVEGIATPDRALARESIAFGIRAWVGSLAAMMNARVDQIIMGFITTEAILGVYSVAVNASEVLLYLPNAIGVAFLPAIIRSDPDHRLPRTLEVLRRLTVVTVAFALVAAAIGVPLIPIVFGHAFHDSSLPFLILLPGALGYGALAVTGAALLAAGAPQQSSLTMAVGLVVGVALDFLLVPPLGANGAATAATTAFLASGAVGVALLHRRTPFPWREAFPGWQDVTTLARGARAAAARPLASIRA